MQYNINVRDLLRKRPDLTEDALMKMPFADVIHIFSESKKVKEDDTYKQPEFKERNKKMCSTLYNKFYRYVPEDVLFKGIYRYVKNLTISEKSSWYIKEDIYIIREERIDNNIFFHYLQYNSFYSDECEESIVRTILEYYYPSFSFLPLNLTVYRLDSVFDQVEIYDTDDFNCDSRPLVVSLIDIITGDVNSIINDNMESTKSGDYLERQNKFFDEDYVADFLFIIKNDRNPNAVYYLPKEGDEDE